MDLVIRTGSLSAELVAGNVKDLKALIVIVLVELFDRFVLRCEAAACRGIYDKYDFSLVIRKLKCLALPVFNS